MWLLNRHLIIPRRRVHASVAPLPYRVIRNSRGSLPVYTDLRNNHSRYVVLVRNIEGDANVLLQDLRATLFPPGSQQATTFRGEVIRSKHLKLRGLGPGWKASVEDWCKQRGF